MGRLIGYVANRADRLRDALHQERAALDAGARRGDGWGLGFYQGGEVLHKKRPQLGDGVVDLGAIAGDVRTHCLVAHVREATVGDFRAENTHPFRMRQWLFAHDGTIDRFGALKARLVDQLPDFLRRNVRGDTDSEHLFHVILSFLHDAGQLDNPDVDERAVLQALRSATSLVDRFVGEVGGRPSTLNCVLTNGRQLYALERGRTFSYVERAGLHDARNGDGSPRALQDAASFRYVMALSDAGAPPSGWNRIGDATVLVVDRDLAVSRHPL
jgi:glutamine amidotransferase